MANYEIDGKEYPVIGECRVVDEEGKPTGDTIPIVDVPLMSDYEWRLLALDSRLKNPNSYADEDVEEKKRNIKQILLDQTTPELYWRYFEKYRGCYDFIYGETKEAIAI